MAYSDKVLDHYTNPRNVGSMDKASTDVGTGLVGAPECGDVMELQIKVRPNGVIEAAKLETFGCGSAIASSVLGSERGVGKAGAAAAARSHRGRVASAPVQHAAAQTRPRLQLRRRARFRGAEVFSLSARHDARLAGDADVSRLPVRESERDEIVRVWDVVQRVRGKELM